MVRHRGMDTSVILEAHRTGSWRALTDGYAVETVEDCVTETQTGFQRRRPEYRIDQAELRDRLAGVHAVGDVERAVLAIRAAISPMPEEAQRRMLELVPFAAARNPIDVAGQFLNDPSLLDQAIELAATSGDYGSLVSFKGSIGRNPALMERWGSRSTRRRRTRLRPSKASRGPSGSGALARPSRPPHRSPPAPSTSSPP